MQKNKEIAMSQSTLPAHIKQLVDKKNYVIAIKTHAQEQGISLDEAKQQIDAYENQALVGQAQFASDKASQPTTQTLTQTTTQPASPNSQPVSHEQGFSVLTQGLDNHLN